MTRLPAERTAARFPQIMRYCQQHGLDITKESIPVSPAAHYMMGGVRTNAWGETNVRNLYACGETACTAVHGANRLASNSLLETVVFAKRVISRTLDKNRQPVQPSPDALSLPSGPGANRLESVLERQDTTFDLSALAEQPLSLLNLQSLMWEKAGIVRDGTGLTELALMLSIWERFAPVPEDRPSHELTNLVISGRLVTEAALIRQESRGAHYRTDFPRPVDSWRRHIVFRKDT